MLKPYPDTGTDPNWQKFADVVVEVPEGTMEARITKNEAAPHFYSHPHTSSDPHASSNHLSGGVHMMIVFTYVFTYMYHLIS